MAPSELSRIVRRNTLLLWAGQALTIISFQINVLIAALAVFQLSGHSALSGLVLGIIWSGRILVSYLSGSLIDKMGRRPILILGGIMAAIS